MNVIQRFSQFYQQIDEDSVADLPSIYAQDVVFIDPVSEHRGLTYVMGYFSNLLTSTEFCRCEIQSIAQQDSEYLVQWQMHFAHPKLKRGQTIEVDGVTQLKVSQDKINYHRDFYDMGQMIYEHVPVLSPVIRFIKKRLAA